MAYTTTAHTSNPDWIIYGSELSPFTLKVLAMCEYKQLDYALYPINANPRDAIKIQLRKILLTTGVLALTYPDKTQDDEFPLVPFMFAGHGLSGDNFYDSSAFATWLDSKINTKYTAQPIMPTDPVLAFLVKLIEEYADEFGLYMVHHNRWKVSAKTNDAGLRLAKEMPSFARPVQKHIARFFSKRQVRRLPYLFSVAPIDYDINGLPKSLQPPSRDGFPATHELLESSFSKLLAAVEPIFTENNWLFGDCPTLADFSLYGQLAMNLTDPDANNWIQQDAPATHAWLKRIYDEGQIQYHADTKLELTQDIAKSLKPLLSEVCRTFVPLMQQNHAAITKFKAERKMVFNEAAFDAGECIYDGNIDGVAYRHVAKSFQAQVWQRLVEQYEQLSVHNRETIDSLLGLKIELR